MNVETASLPTFDVDTGSSESALLTEDGDEFAAESVLTEVVIHRGRKLKRKLKNSATVSVPRSSSVDVNASRSPPDPVESPENGARNPENALGSSENAANSDRHLNGEIRANGVETKNEKVDAFLEKNAGSLDQSREFLENFLEKDILGFQSTEKTEVVEEIEENGGENGSESGAEFEKSPKILESDEKVEKICEKVEKNWSEFVDQTENSPEQPKESQTSLDLRSPIQQNKTFEADFETLLRQNAAISAEKFVPVPKWASEHDDIRFGSSKEYFGSSKDHLGSFDGKNITASSSARELSSLDSPGGSFSPAKFFEIDIWSRTRTDNIPVSISGCNFYICFADFKRTVWFATLEESDLYWRNIPEKADAVAVSPRGKMMWRVLNGQAFALAKVKNFLVN